MSANTNTASAFSRTDGARVSSRQGSTPLAQRLEVWSPRVLSVVRIVTALLFMEHGLMKLVHFPAAIPGAPDPLPAI